MSTKRLVRLFAGAAVGVGLMIASAATSASACWNCVAGTGCSSDENASFTCQDTKADNCNLTMNNCTPLQ
jgi:hypothetical protein